MLLNTAKTPRLNVAMLVAINRYECLEWYHHKVISRGRKYHPNAECHANKISKDLTKILDLFDAALYTFCILLSLHL